MYEDITENQLAEICSKFSNHNTKLSNDIQKSYTKDEKDERKFLEKHLAINNAILTNVRKLRNLIASKDS